MLPLLLFFAAAAADKPKMGPVEKEHKMVVDAVRGCPEQTDEDEIVVCSNDRGIAEGYRLPKLDPRFATNVRKNGRGGLTDSSLGASGAGSCSTTGAGGATGCSKREYNAWAQWKQDKKKEDQLPYESPD